MSSIIKFKNDRNDSEYHSYGAEVNGKETGTFDGIVTIILTNSKNKVKAKEYIITANGTDTDKFICLDDCLELIGYNGSGVVTVIIEGLLSGRIYQYGNHTDCDWVWHSETNGYA